MFTGIIETVGKVVDLKRDRTNLDILIESEISSGLKIDQSVAHNGVCLTVVDLKGDTHLVTAVEETLRRSSFSSLRPGDLINLERSVQINGRFEGHIVQGHVDCVAGCKKIVDRNGSHEYFFEYEPQADFITVQKGSIGVNGVSLTVVESDMNLFSTVIIPYTFQNTNFKSLKEGDVVNIEFDIIGKYIVKAIGTGNYKSVFSKSSLL